MALHWLWLPEWLELLASCDSGDGDKGEWQGLKGKSGWLGQWGQSGPNSGRDLPPFLSYNSGFGVTLSSWTGRAAGGGLKGRQINSWQSDGEEEVAHKGQRAGCRGLMWGSYSSKIAFYTSYIFTHTHTEGTGGRELCRPHCPPWCLSTPLQALKG